MIWSFISVVFQDRELVFHLGGLSGYWSVKKVVVHQLVFTSVV